MRVSSWGMDVRNDIDGYKTQEAQDMITPLVGSYNRGRLLLQNNVFDVEVDLLFAWRWHRLQTESLERLELTFRVVHLAVLEVYVFRREYALCKRHPLNTVLGRTPKLQCYKSKKRV